MGEKRQPVVFVGHGSPLNAIADPESFTPEHITVVLDTYLARLAA